MPTLSINNAIRKGAFQKTQPKQIKLSENITKIVNNNGNYSVIEHEQNGNIFKSEYDAKDKLIGLMEIDNSGKIYALDKDANKIDIIV